MKYFAWVFLMGCLTISVMAQRSDSTKKSTAAVLDFRALTVLKKEEVTVLAKKMLLVRVAFSRSENIQARPAVFGKIGVTN